MLLRPRLNLRLDGPPFIDLSSLVFYLTQAGGKQAYPALYLRGWVWNFGAETARECQVFLECLSIGGEVLSDERSPLAWTHEDGTDRFVPRSLPRAEKRGLRFDICKADGYAAELQFCTKRAEKGFDTLVQTARVTARIVAEAASGASSSWLEVDLDYNRPDQQFSITDIRKRKRFRVW